MEQNGIDKALAKAGGATFYERANKLAELLGVTVQFIYKSQKKGWLPIDRARQVSDAYGVPLIELVRANVRAAISNQ